MAGLAEVNDAALTVLGQGSSLALTTIADRLLVGSVELDVPVRSNWAVALFADAGSAYNDSPEFSESVGIGLRWFSPLGPVRVDLAHPLDDTGQTVRLHISLGPDI